MNAHLVNAKAEFWRAYAVVRDSLANRPVPELRDLQHEAESLKNHVSVPFSERAAANMVYAACTEILEAK
jgi:hypothetical protein